MVDNDNDSVMDDAAPLTCAPAVAEISQSRGDPRLPASPNNKPQLPHHPEMIRDKQVERGVFRQASPQPVSMTMDVLTIDYASVEISVSVSRPNAPAADLIFPMRYTMGVLDDFPYTDRDVAGALVPFCAIDIRGGLWRLRVSAK